LEPACISSKPSILESLVERAVLKPQFSLRPLDFIVSSGAKLEAGLQVRLEETFGTRAIEAYGMTEFGVVGYPCRQGALHVDMTSTFIEVIDSEGKVLPDGQLGELVVSSLSNRAMPFLRYKTGDLGALETANCACGSLAPRLMKLSGRIIRCLQLPSGRFFPPTYFNDLFVRFPCLKEFQITQIARNTLEILLEPQSGTTVPNNELVDQVHLYVRDSLGEPMSVHVRVVTFRKDCKFERFRTNF
jgi:phenylacetate-CoA ligase